MALLISLESSRFTCSRRGWSLVLLALAGIWCLPERLHAQGGNPKVTAGRARVEEGASGTTTAGVPVYLSAAAAAPVTVSWTTEDGTATSGQDYVAASGSLVFQPGELVHTIPVTIIGDADDEHTESLSVILFNPTGASLGESIGRLLITADEPVTALSLPATLMEFESGATPAAPQFLVGNPQAARTARASVSSGTATVGQDLELHPAGGTLDLSQTPSPLPLRLLDDSLQETDESFQFQVAETGPGVRLLPGAPDQAVAASLELKTLVIDGDTLAAIDGSRIKIWRRGPAGWEWETDIPATTEGGVSTIALDQGLLAADFPATGVKLYERVAGSWSVVATLPRRSAEPDWTRVLSLQDDTLAIGDPAPSGHPVDTGRVWIHERHAGGPHAWGLQATLTPPVPSPSFGTALALWGDALAVGAPDVYSIGLFHREPSTREWQLTREMVRFIPDFGRVFALEGSLLIAPENQRWLTLQRASAQGIWEEKSLPSPAILTAGSPIILRGGVVCAFSGATVRFLSRPGTEAWSFAGPPREYPSPPGTASLLAFDGRTLVRTGANSPTLLPILVNEPAVTQAVIIDDDSIRFTIDNAVTESATNVNNFFTTVHLSRPLPVKVRVTVSDRSGTALPESDYRMWTREVEFEPGQTSQSVGFVALAPDPGEGPESFYLPLSSPTSGSLGPDATITIVPHAPGISFASQSTSVLEGQTGTTTVTIPVKLSRPAPEGAFYRWIVQYPDTIPANTVVATSGLVAVPAGATTSSFDVLILGDTRPEAPWTLNILLEETIRLNGPKFDENNFYLTILNDDSGTPANDVFTVAQGGSLTANVTTNDTGMGVTQVVNTTTNGVFKLSLTGEVTYTPNPNFFGRDTFSYRDAFEIYNFPALVATSVIEVADARIPPLLQPDGVFATLEETPLDHTGPASVSLFRNDKLLDNFGVAFDPILEIRILDATKGTVSDTGSLDGRFKFTPATDVIGDGGFSYQVRDKDGWSDPARVTIRVNDDFDLGPLQQVGPPGSQLFLASSTRVRIPDVGVVDHLVALRAGQTVSLRVANTGGTPVARIEVRNASGIALSGGRRSTNALEHVPIPADGTYKLILGGEGTLASYPVSVLVNGGLSGQPTDPAVPYSLDSARPPHSLRAAVYTTTPSSGPVPHQYAFTAAAGETIRLHLQSTVPQAFKLQSAEGVVLAQSAASPGDSTASALQHTLAADGSYHVVVDAPRSAKYSLLLYRNAHAHDHLAGGPPPLVTAAAGALDGRGARSSGPAGSSLSFAAFSNYGSGDANGAAVAALVSSWQPDFVIAAGDHNSNANYAVGDVTWSRNAGALYGNFMKGRQDNRYPEQTSLVQKFFTVPGNRDSGPDTNDGGEMSAYFDYFHVNPGAASRLPAGVHQPRLSHYKMSWGPADFFMIDSDSASIDQAGHATQRPWLREQIAASTARWKFGVWHHSPYSSGANHGNHPEMQWGEDFRGLTAIITGQDRVYERLDIGQGVTQFTTGLGGSSIYQFNTPPVPQSLVRYNAAHGALRGVVGPDGVRFEFRAVGRPGGIPIDSWTVGTPPPVTLATGTGSDIWPLTVRPGQSLRLATRTPPPPGSLSTDIDPALELLDAAGTVVATATAGAPDGRNAVLIYTVPGVPASPDETLAWSVRVMNEAHGAGEYELEVGSPAPGSFEAWILAHIAGAQTGPGDDPDGDSLPNLFEFLTAGDPARPNQPVVPPLEITSDGTRSIRIHLPAEWSLPLTVRLQSSPSLDAGGWVTLATKRAGTPWTSDQPTAPTAHPDGGFVVTLPSNSSSFFRLALSLD